MDTGTKGGDHSLDLGIDKDLVQPCLFHVKDLTTQGKDRLGGAGTGRFGGAAGGISLNNINFAVGRILVGAVGQLARKAGGFQSRLTAGQITGLLAASLAL